MKKLIFILSVFISADLSAQRISTDNVPAVVADAFHSKFSIAGKTDWEMDYDNYQADFEVGKANFSATFDKDGKWLKTETYIKSFDLPKIVKDCITKNFAGYNIDDPEKVETPTTGIDYEMELSKDDLIYEVSISDKGVLLKHELKKEDDIKPKAKRK